MQAHTSKTSESSTDLHLSPWVYALLAGVFAVVGICASAVTADFFIVGLLKLEADATARNALIAAGVLMIVAEVLSFGVAGLLPRKQMGSLRCKLIVFGLALLVFEIVTIYVTQVALAQASTVEAKATHTRIESIEKSIGGLLASAAALRTNAERQTESKHPWIRAEGAKILKSAVALEIEAAAKGQELAALQLTERPTMTGILGYSGMVGYSVARALLISVVGIMMCAAAGALLRARRSAIAAVVTQVGSHELNELNAQEAQVATLAHEHHATFSAPMLVRYACIVPAVTLSAPVLDIPAFTQPTSQIKAPQADVALSEDSANSPSEFALVSQRQTGEAATKLRPAMQDTGTGDDDGTRFQRVREAILAQQIPPSIRAIWSLAGASQRVAQRYLEAMASAGEIQRGTKGYRLVNEFEQLKTA